MDEIRPFYHHVESCQETVPEAIIAFLEAGDFEDTVRNAVSIGGDTDTLAAIAGSIAEAFYGVPEELREVAILSFFQELKQREIAELLQIKLSLVKYRIGRAKELLIKELEVEE